MGWNGNGKPQSNAQTIGRKALPSKKTSTIKRCILAGIFVVLVSAVAICYMAMSGRKTSVPAPETPKAKKIVDKAQPELQPAKVEQADDERAKKIARLKAMTPEERLEFLYDEAKKRPLDLTPSTNRVFRTGVEQVMSWIFTTKLGDPPPPLPRMSIFDEVHLAEIIIADNPVLETDSEKVKECKEMVALAKKELIAYIKEGGNVEDFLAYYRDQLKEAYHDFTSAKQKIFQAYIDGEDPEVCRVYAEQVNAELARKGIKQVSVPQALIDKFSRQK